MIKVLLVEDMTILRESLEKNLDSNSNIEIVGSIDDAHLAKSMCEKYKPDLILMDICTSNGSSGIDATYEIKRNYPDIKVILMTDVPDITFISDAKKAGADSFIYKNIDSNELINTIIQTMNGYTIYPNNNDFKCDFLLSDLTNKELKVLKLLCEAKTRKEICEIEKITDGYLRNIISNILNKTGFDSISRLSIYIVSHGFIHINK